MARERSGPLAPPSSELAGLIGPNGPVTVPGELLRLLVCTLTDQARSTDGQPSPAKRPLHNTLYYNDAHRERAVPSPEQPPSSAAASDRSDEVLSVRHTS